MTSEQNKQINKPISDSAAPAALENQNALGRTVRRLNRDLSSVRETSELLNAPLELPQVLELVVKTVAQAVGADAAGLRLLDKESGQLVLKATYGLSQAYIEKGPVTAVESSLNMRALAGEVIVVKDMGSDERFGRYRDAVGREGLVSSLTIGLTYKDHGIGTLRLYNKRKRRFSDSDISVAQTVAAQSAAAIVNARLYAEALEAERMGRQLKLAAEVQRRLLPNKPPVVEGLELAGLYAPCYELGGDLYDFFTVGDGRLVVLIGDVMGKGVSASLAMASLRSSLRAQAQHDADLGHLIWRVNRMFTRDIAYGEFATLFVAVVEPASGRMTYCNCGHEPPLLLHGGQFTRLEEGGTVLGLDLESQFSIGEVQLRPGHMLVMYTDGLTETGNFAREPFGQQRLLETVVASSEMTAEQAAKNILWSMRKFTGLTRRSDDVAIVVMKKKDPSQGEAVRTP